MSALGSLGAPLLVVVAVDAVPGLDDVTLSVLPVETQTSTNPLLRVFVLERSVRQRGAHPAEAVLIAAGLKYGSKT